MKLQLKNKDLGDIAGFLNGLTLRGAKTNIARIRITNLILAKTKEIQEDRVEVIKEFANLDEHGMPARVKDAKGAPTSTYDIPDDNLTAANQAVADLENETSVISVTEHEAHLRTLKQALENYSYELNGQQAACLVTLLDAFEVAVAGKKEGK